MFPKYKFTHKFILFSTLSLLLGFGYANGFFASNSLLIHRVGPEVLFETYLISSLFALGASGLFYLLADRFTRAQLLMGSYFFSGVSIIVGWVFLVMTVPPLWVYQFLRIFLYVVFILTNLVYWLVASEHFTHQEAKQYFPLLISMEVSGEMLGGFFVNQFATRLHTVNFILIWGIVLTLIAGIFWQNRTISLESKPPDASEAPEKTLSVRSTFGLASLLFIFWFCYSFLASGTDYLFNATVLHSFASEDLVTAFFGRVTLCATFMVLIYQLFLAVRLTSKLGAHRVFFMLCVLFCLLLGGMVFSPSLNTVSLAQGGIFFFIDFATMALFASLLNIFPSSIRGRVITLSEGLGRPAGALLLLLFASAIPMQWNNHSMMLILFGAAVLFLVFPIFFRRIYLKHLLQGLESKDSYLALNTVQALGEPKNTQAVAPLLKLLKTTDSINLKSNIVFSLGHIQSREIFADIVNLFTTGDQVLREAVLQTLTSYHSHEAALVLLKLLKPNGKIPAKIQMNSVLFLTKLMGKKMVPFLFDALLNEDSRIRANAIEGLGLLKDRKMIPILLPFLKDDHHRICANAIVALYPFSPVRIQALKALDELFYSSASTHYRAAFYVISQLKLYQYETALFQKLAHREPGIENTFSHTKIILSPQWETIQNVIL